MSGALSDNEIKSLLKPRHLHPEHELRLNNLLFGCEFMMGETQKKSVEALGITLQEYKPLYQERTLLYYNAKYISIQQQGEVRE